MSLSKFARRAAAGGVLIVLMLVASLLHGAGPATASGLTAAQAAALQAKADNYLAEYGSAAKQVAPDRIVLPGAELVLAKPGQALAVPCPFHYFCAYSAQWFTGDVVMMEQCGAFTAKPERWVDFGSWKNNQTSGTRSWIYFYGENPPWQMPGAYAEQASGVGWYPVEGFRPC